MRIGLVLVALFLTFGASAQLQIKQMDTLSYQHEVILDGTLDFSATSMRQDLLSKFTRGGFISDDIKENSLAKHGAVNRVGAEVGAEIEYRNYSLKLFKKKDWGMVFKGGYHVFGGVLYSKDMFGLAMYGNENYLGDTAIMSGTDVSMTAFQKIGIGFVDAKRKSNVTFNVYNISNRISADFRDFELSQSEDGEEVTLVMDGEVEMTKNLKFNQGIGFGFDLDFRFPISWYKERKANIQFLAKNVGFGYMYEDQQRYSFDTTINFTGFRFEELVGDNALFSDSASVMDSLGITSKDVNSVFMLPGYLQIGKMVDRQSDYQVQSFFGARVYPTLIYSPYLFAGVDYKPLDWLNVGASLSYGGFAGFKTGIYAHMGWDQVQVGLATDNLIGWVHKAGNGQSLFIRLKCAI